MFVSPLLLLGAASCFDVKNPLFHFRRLLSAARCILGESWVRTKVTWFRPSSGLGHTQPGDAAANPGSSSREHARKTKSVQRFTRAARAALLEPTRLLHTQTEAGDSEWGLFWIRSRLQGCCILCCIPASGTASRRPPFSFCQICSGKDG